MQFTAIGTYEDTTTEDMTNRVTWYILDVSKASISKTGMVTAISPGTTSIMASLTYAEAIVPLTVTAGVQVVATEPGIFTDADGLPGNGIVKVQFDSDINPDTLNATTFQILDASDNALAGTITYDSATRAASFTFSSPVTRPDYYHIFVSPGILDTNGGRFLEPYVTWFYDTGTPDADPPVILRSNPGPGGKDAPLHEPITVSFNEPFDVIGLAGSSLVVTDQNNTVVPGKTTFNWGNYDYYTADFVMIFTPDAPLEKVSTYTLTIPSVKDYAGNATSQSTYTFSTLPIVAPTDLTVSPTQGELQATLSWLPVDGATSYNVYWSNTPGVNKQNGTRISNVTNPYTHTGLSDNTYYYVVTAVNDLGEGPVSNEASTLVDTTPPTVTAVSPLDGTTGVPLNQRVCVSFSESINWSGWNATNVSIVDSTGTPAAGSFAGNPCSTNTYPFRPWPNLKHDTQYTVTINNVTDSHGNVIESPYSWSFTTQSMVAPVITARPNSVVGMIYVSATNGQSVNATTYRVYYSQAPGVTPQNGTMQSGYSSANVAGLTSGVTYYFVMTGVYGDEEGPVSSEVSAVAP